VSYAGASHLARTAALESGAVSPEGFELTYLALPVPDAFARMVRHGEFDASELSLAAYMAMVAAGDRRFVGLPIFPARYFRQRQLYVREGSGLEHPQDLAGRRVGVPDYHQTAALWARAFLLHDYGLAPESLRWVRGGLDRPGRLEQLGLAPPATVSLEDAPEGRSLGELLLAGELDALIAPRSPAVFRPGSPVVRLFPDYARVERDYYARTGIFPIMHLVVVARERLEQAPTLACALLEAFVESKRRGHAALLDPEGDPLADPWWEERVGELERLFGGDPFPYGLERNRAVLEAALAYAWEQGLLARPLEPEELFAPETWSHRGG
jgi:4,5-dihydroxyphthalate decarboxylase